MRWRVLHVVPYFYPAWAYGGIPRLVYGLARQQARDGHAVTVATTDALDAQQRTSPDPHDRPADGIRVVRFANLSNRLAYRHQLFLPRGMGAFLRRAVPDHDVVHVHGHRHLPGSLAAREASRAGVAAVLTPNGTAPALERKRGAKRLWDAAIGDATLRSFDVVIAVSRAELAQLRGLGIPAPRIRLVPNGIELAEFERAPARGAFRAAEGLGDAPLVLYLGKITPRKGVDHLLRAFARLARPDARLVIAGNDMTGELPRLRRLARRLALGERARFVGLLVGPRRLQALADADVLVYPSEHEIFGLVPFEGLLSGTPVVVGDDCGCGELVTRARAGFQVRFGDADGLAAHIGRLLDDRAIGASMVARGRAYVARHFAWPVVSQETEAAYTAALGRRRG